jgi:hypothetical protein
MRQIFDAHMEGLRCVVEYGVVGDAEIVIPQIEMIVHAGKAVRKPLSKSTKESRVEEQCPTKRTVISIWSVGHLYQAVLTEDVVAWRDEGPDGCSRMCSYEGSTCCR